MNVAQVYEKAKKIYDEYERTWENWDEGYEFIGLRFEDKERELGETCECSRHNGDREDARDFPQYGTDEYWEMEELNGTSAWNLGNPSTYRVNTGCKEWDCRNYFTGKHCYVIASNDLARHDDPDYGEIVIRNATVIAKIF